MEEEKTARKGMPSELRHMDIVEKKEHKIDENKERSWQFRVSFDDVRLNLE